MTIRLSYVAATPEVAHSPIAWTGWSADVLAQIAAIGYEGVELQTRDPETLEAAVLLRDAAAAGLEIAGLSTGPIASNDGLALVHADAEVRAQALDRLLAATRLAGDLGTHVTVGSIRGSLSSAPDTGIGMSWLRSALETVLDEAVRRDVLVVLEPQSRQMTDVFNRIEDTAAFMDSMASPNLALEVDSYHMVLEEQSVPAALVAAHQTGRLVHVQVSDTNRLAPGWGHMNWSDFFSTLVALDYGGWVSIEVTQRPDSRSAAIQGHRMISAVLATLPASSGGNRVR